MSAVTPAAPRAIEPRPIPWGLILGVWTVYGLLNSGQAYIGALLAGRSPITFWTAMLLQLPQAYTWAVVTPAILWLGRRFPFERGKWPTSAAVHIAISLAFVFLVDLGFAFHNSNVQPTPTPLPLLTQTVRLFVWWVLADGLLYWMVLSVGYAVERDRRFRERELAASQLETQLAHARLTGLKMQLQPHFLFNALHTIGTLVRTGQSPLAVRVVAGLGDLLRAMLDDAATQEVPLRQELAFLRSYLDIEQIRFSDRLQVVFSVDDDTLDASVPHLILQPLVENAIRHGIASDARGGRLVVSARRVDRQLLLAVRDDGQGMGSANGVATRRGHGLSNIENRLAQLFGTDFSVVVERASSGGTEARITIPYRPAPAAEAR